MALLVRAESAPIMAKQIKIGAILATNIDKTCCTPKGIALSRDRILNLVWNYDYYGDLRTVDTHVKQLRAKLKDAGKYISTVRSIGYKLETKYEKEELNNEA